VTGPPPDASPAGLEPHRVVIVGGGFAGLTAARELARAPVSVTVVDRRNHHLFQPLLYQVATAALAAPDIAAPIRQVLSRSANTRVLLAEVTAILPEERAVRLADGELGYDALILAAGLEHFYFGHDDWVPFAPGLKSLEDAFEIRRRVLLAFEAAEREEDAGRRREWLSFVVIGAGPTGVELAGALREIAMKTLSRDFRRFDARSARVVLVEKALRVLPGFPEGLSARALRMLEARGVEVRTGALVTALGPEGVRLGDELVAARTVLWAAGVRASPLAASLGVPLARDGRLLVAADLSLPGHPEIFAAGDLVALEQDGVPVPGMAPAAIQEGRWAARNLLRALRGEPTLPFRYRDRGLLATIGRAAAVARVGRFEFGGRLAWILWLCVHIVWLIGFRNRVVVLFEWAWAYLTWQRSARVIVEAPGAPGPAAIPPSRAPGDAHRGPESRPPFPHPSG